MEFVEGSGRPPPRRGAPSVLRPGDRVPPIDFGPYGELTPRSIAQAGLTGQEKQRAYEMMAVHSAYLQILECLDYTVDADNVHHSFAAIPATKLAVAYHLAKCGFRRTGTSYVQKLDPTTPQPAPAAGPLPGEGWHTPPVITYEHTPRNQL